MCWFGVLLEGSRSQLLLGMVGFLKKVLQQLFVVVRATGIDVVARS